MHRDKTGETALMLLFQSYNLLLVNYDSLAFKLLFKKEKYMINSNNESVLMILCESQQRLLNYKLWFIPELLELIGIKDINGMTATMIYRNFYDTDLNSYGYRRLLQAEVNWK